MTVEQASVLQALTVVQDPDLHRDIVALGFVKDLAIDGGRVAFTIELTTPACPLKDEIEMNAQAAVKGIGADAVDITWAAMVRRAAPARAQQLVPGVKNVIAIGAGVCHGLGLGSNSLAALITRGLAEMTRLAVAMGGEARTLAGLAGLGDLVLTCSGALSRNRSVGLQLASGRTIDEIVGSMRMVAEGIETTKATVDLARRHGVEMPIAEQMHAMLFEARAPGEAIRQSMERSLKGE